MSPLCLVPEKNNMAFGFFYKSPGNKFLRPFESKYEYCIFLYELFVILRKVLSALDYACFFFEIFYRTTTHMIFFTDFYQLIYSTMQIKLTAALLKEPANLL